jgi:hypothetical protein
MVRHGAREVSRQFARRAPGAAPEKSRAHFDASRTGHCASARSYPTTYVVMSMPYDTDERLKSYLDTNQLHREQMCLSLLAIDRRFTDVKPRQPRGGPDGGRDIEAVFRGEKVFGAVGFVNQADDSDQKRRVAEGKFESDLQSALEAEPGLKAFVFFTNVNLTVGEEDHLMAMARAKSVGHCEIFDRERMRISLDSPDGLSIRFQFLKIELSPAEQAAFFARWGDDIQNLIAQGFSQIRVALNRMQFLYESNSVLDHFAVVIELDREYEPAEIGHFRLFCNLHLKEPKNGILAVQFGTTDNASRIEATNEAGINPQEAGVEHGMCGGQWEVHLSEQSSADAAEGTSLASDSEQDELQYKQTSTFTSIGLRKVGSLKADFGFHSFIRLGPYFCLKDLDDCMFVIFVNRSLSDKIKRIHVFGNEYKLSEIDRQSLRVDTGFERFRPCLAFSARELEDEWVRVMPGLGTFRLTFSSTTPLRLFEPDRVVDSQIRNRSR